MTETAIKKVQTVNTTSPTVEVSTNQQQQKVDQPITLLDEYEKSKDAYFNSPNLTEEQRQQLGHASYIERVPDFVRSKTKGVITLKGITTSRVEQALKGSKTQGEHPYPARVFLRLDCVDCHNTKQLCQVLTPKHRKCEECAKQKCRECEIPVFFRIKEKDN